MVIEIDLRTSPASIELAAPDDFAAFKVLARAHHKDADRLRSALAHIGRLGDSGHAFVPIDALERLPARASTDSTVSATIDVLAGRPSTMRSRGLTAKSTQCTRPETT